MAAVASLAIATVPSVTYSRRSSSSALSRVAFRRAPRLARRASSDKDDNTPGNSDQGIFMRQITPEEKDAEVKWLGGMLKLWLDDEWSLQEPHKELGLRAAEKCTAMRLEGCEEMGSLVMGVAAELIEFDFSDTFVNAFEVANKCSEILMMREGYEVCCINKDDVSRQARYEEIVANGEA